MNNRKYIQLFSLIIISFSVFGQPSTKTEPLLLGVEYEFTHQYDIQDTSQQISHNMVLHIGENRSVYYLAAVASTAPWPDYLLNFTPSPAMQEAMRKGTMEGNKTINKVPVTIQSKFIPSEKYSYIPAENKVVMYSETQSMGSYIVDIPPYEINWEIKDDTREIGGINCQKAVGIFKGRTYTAWFAPSLPFPYGPWKLNGLPGLILEAEDSKKEVQFIFKDLFKAQKDEVLHYDILIAVPVSEQKYLKIKDKFYASPLRQSKKALSSNEVLSGYRFRTSTGQELSGDEALEAIKEEIKIKVTNPLELK